MVNYADSHGDDDLAVHYILSPSDLDHKMIESTRNASIKKLLLN